MLQESINLSLELKSAENVVDSSVSDTIEACMNVNVSKSIFTQPMKRES